MGGTVVADLIQNGSWERDFFTVSLRRGDVRVKWCQWWHNKQDKEHAKPTQVRETLLLKDVENMRNGLVCYMGKAKHQTVINRNHGWLLVWHVFLHLEALETSAVDYCWIVGQSHYLVVPVSSKVFDSLLEEDEEDEVNEIDS